MSINIIVPFSLVFDQSGMLISDWEKLKQGDPDIIRSKKVIDAYDESAAEYALVIRDSLREAGQEVTLIGITVGTHINKRISQNLFAVGFDRLCVLEYAIDSLTQQDAVADILTGFIRSTGLECLVLTGQMNSESCCGCTPARLSYRLGLPYIGYVSELTVVKDRLWVKCKTRGGYMSRTVPMRGVFAFQDAARSYLRVSTLRERAAVRSKTVEFIPSVCNDAPSVTLERLDIAGQKRCCCFITGADTAERAALLLELFLEEVD